MKKSLVASPYQICQLLEIKYGEKIEFNNNALLPNRIEGVYKGALISIIFSKDESLSISIPSNDKGLLQELTPALNEIMNDEPICSYDIKIGELIEEPSISIIEWEIKNPEKRIIEIVNDTTFEINYKVCNIVLFQGRKIETYLEAALTKDKQMVKEQY